MDDWATEDLGFFVRITKSQITPATFPNETFAYYSIPAFDATGGPIAQEGRNIESGKFSLVCPAVLVSKLNPRKMRVQAFESSCGRRAVASTEFIVYEPRVDGVELHYLKHLLSSNEFSRRRQAVATGTTNSHVRVRPSETLRWPVRMPPLEEQRRIAEILDTIDETIQATERVIAKLWSERTGAMEDQLASIDNQYGYSPLLDVVSLPSGQVDPRVEPHASLILVAPDHILGDGRGRLIARASAKAQRAISGKYRFEAGSVVYSKIRPELRKAWLATFDGLCSADMYPLSPAPGLVGGYLASVILGQRFSRYAASVSGRSSGMPKVNRRELAEFQIALPRLEVQKTVASLAESYDRRMDAETAALRKTIEVRRGLAADLLSGSVRTVAS